MKRILLFLLLVAVACGKESGVSPGNASTFVRYFNGGNNDFSHAVIETSDKGLLILATTQIQPNELTAPHYKIKLIKTDNYGNQLWQKFYPAFSDTGSYKAGGMYVLADGSIAIAGTHILKSGVSNLMLLTTDDKGDNPKKTTIFSPQNTNGTAVTENANGEYLILGHIVQPGVSKNMQISLISSDLSTTIWSFKYGAGQVVSFTNKVYLDAPKINVFWGGTVNRNSINSIRLVDIFVDPSNIGSIIADVPFGNPAFNVFGSDFVRFGETWAFVGSTDEKKDASGNSSTGDFDILYYRVDPSSGIVLSLKTFPIEGVGAAKDGANQNEVGNSICATQNGGLLLLGTVNSQGSFGRGGKDYYLIKIDAFGGVEWQYSYGSKFDDNGVQVIQASDGGYIVLGTTNLANLKSIMLMKTGKDGKIQ